MEGNHAPGDTTDDAGANRDSRASVAGLLDALLTTDVTALEDAALREVLTDSEAARNAVEALQARAMVEIHRRAEHDDLSDLALLNASVPVGKRAEFVVDEIAVHLRCSRVAASHRFAVAMTAANHPPLGQAWGRGVIDARKVQVIGEGLSGLDAVFAETLATAAAEHASKRTAPQVRAWLSRRVIAAHPAAAEERRERATAGRHVRVQALPDGVAQLSALMPAIQARQIYETLTALAHQTDGDDARTLDQRRSDALFDLTTGRAEPAQVHLSVTAPAATVAGLGDQPADVHGLGPIDPALLRDLLGSGAAPTSATGTSDHVTWRRLLLDPVAGTLVDLCDRQYRPSAPLDRAVRARDLTCRFPGCRRPATTPRSGVDLDHTIPWPRGQTSADNLACLCRHHHRLKHSPGWGVTLVADGTMEWTTPGGRRFTTRPWVYHDPVPSEAVDPPQAA